MCRSRLGHSCARTVGQLALQSRHQRQPACPRRCDRRACDSRRCLTIVRQDDVTEGLLHGGLQYLKQAGGGGAQSALGQPPIAADKQIKPQRSVA